jgi:Iap family predicted aminopeptidase
LLWKTKADYKIKVFSLCKRFAGSGGAGEEKKIVYGDRSERETWSVVHNEIIKLYLFANVLLCEVEKNYFSIRAVIAKSSHFQGLNCGIQETLLYLFKKKKQKEMYLQKLIKRLQSSAEVLRNAQPHKIEFYDIFIYICIFLQFNYHK